MVCLTGSLSFSDINALSVFTSGTLCILCRLTGRENAQSSEIHLAVGFERVVKCQPVRSLLSRLFSDSASQFPWATAAPCEHRPPATGRSPPLLTTPPPRVGQSQRDQVSETAQPLPPWRSQVWRRSAKRPTASGSGWAPVWVTAGWPSTRSSFIDRLPQKTFPLWASNVERGAERRVRPTTASTGGEGEKERTR